MIIITNIELPESVIAKAAFLLAVSVLEMPNDRVVYCGTISCGQNFAF